MISPKGLKRWECGYRRINVNDIKHRLDLGSYGPVVHPRTGATPAALYAVLHSILIARNPTCQPAHPPVGLFLLLLFPFSLLLFPKLARLALVRLWKLCEAYALWRGPARARRSRGFQYALSRR